MASPPRKARRSADDAGDSETARPRAPPRARPSAAAPKEPEPDPELLELRRRTQFLRAMDRYKRQHGQDLPELDRGAGRAARAGGGSSPAKLEAERRRGASPSPETRSGPCRRPGGWCSDSPWDLEDAVTATPRSSRPAPASPTGACAVGASAAAARRRCRVSPRAAARVLAPRQSLGSPPRAPARDSHEASPVVAECTMRGKPQRDVGEAGTRWTCALGSGRAACYAADVSGRRGEELARPHEGAPRRDSSAISDGQDERRRARIPRAALRSGQARGCGSGEVRASVPGL